MTETRELRSDELLALLELYQHLHTEDPVPEDRDRYRSTWDRICQNSDILCLGTFLEKALIASCILNILPNLTRGCRSYGLIENVVTHPAHRRQGYGSDLLQFALEHAWAQDCYKVMLLTGRKDEGTYQFYEKAGFDRHAKQAFLAQKTYT